MNPAPGKPPVKDVDAGSLSRAGDLFQLLRDGKARTRAELALSTGLARSTVASRIDALILSGLVGPAGEALSSGGRPPSRFAFNPAARLVLAVDVGATHVIVAVTDLGGKILAEHRLAQQVADGPEAVLDQVISQGKELLAAAGRSAEELAGVGIGLPGPVEHDSGRPVKPPIMPGWDGFDVVRYVQQALPVPVLVDNDVNIMALGERASHWSEHDNFFFVKVATGIGSGIISSGELQRGANGTAGDLGHVQLSRGEDVLCACGNHGCLETVASGAALARELRAAGRDAETPGDIIRLIRSGDSLATSLVRSAGSRLGDVLAGSVNLINPDAVLLTGALSTIEPFLAAVRARIYEGCHPLATQRLSIEAASLGPDAGVRGAAQLLLEQLQRA